MTVTKTIITGDWLLPAYVDGNDATALRDNKLVYTSLYFYRSLEECIVDDWSEDYEAT